MVEILIILFLIIINGFLAMAEIAVISARKSKLKQMAEKGNNGATQVLELTNNPNLFIATVQIGISFVSILAGVFGGKTIAHSLAQSLAPLPFIGVYSEPLSLLTVVCFVTYFSLLIGELIPKRLALHRPEKIASLMVKPIQILSSISSPLVHLLSFSTNAIFKLLDIKLDQEVRITEEEVKMMVKDGVRAGVFEWAEKDIVERTFRLSDKKVNMLMTPRKEIKWLDIGQGSSHIKNIISTHSFSYFPVCRNNIDKVIGIVRAKEILKNYLTDDDLDLEKALQNPLFIPESMYALKVLELFRRSGIHLALVVDEYGNVAGLLSITDLLAAIVGDIPSADETVEREIAKRKDGSWLIDGLLQLDKFKHYFNLKKIPQEETDLFNTVGGFVMHRIGRVPKVGNTFTWDGFKLEVVDMDGHRVDKVLLKRITDKIKS